MRKGLRVFTRLPVSGLVALAQNAERWGYDSLWVSDEGLGRDVYVTLTAMAAATERLRLGPGITNLYTRHVATTAAAVATLHEYSGGRAFLGLGAGGRQVSDRMGIRREAPLLRARAAVDVCRGLWQGESVSYNQGAVRLSGASLDMPPQAIDIWIGARGPRLLRLAVELADGIWLDGFAKAALAAYLAEIRQLARAQGRSVRVAATVFVAPDAATQEALRPYLASVLADSPTMAGTPPGLDPDLAAAVRRAVAAAETARAAALIPAAVLSQYAVTGSPGDCVDEIRALGRDLALDEIVLANHLALPTFELAARVLAAV